MSRRRSSARSCRATRRTCIAASTWCSREGKRKVGVLGFSFKAGTDDLRESPIVELIERLIGKGFDLRLYDRNVNLAKLTGANRDYILNHIPHIANLMRESIAEVLEHADVVVIGNSASRSSRRCRGCCATARRSIDLVRIKADFGDTSALFRYLLVTIRRRGGRSCQNKIEF